MAELIRMPKMSDTMQQGILNRWLKQVGDQVCAGDILAEVETDKATMELEAYEDGILLHIGIAEKAAAKVNDVIAIIGAPGEDISVLLASAVEPLSTSCPSDERLTVEQLPNTVSGTKSIDEAPSSSLPTRTLASPLAKVIAKERNYAISDIKGSGPAGRIIKQDVLQFEPKKVNGLSGLEPHASFKEGYEEFPRSTMRQAIANILTTSKATVPHFYLTIQINMDKLVALRNQLNVYASTKISINDVLIRATALALAKHPRVNAAWVDDTIRCYSHVHIGVAVALEDGLIVPILPFADQKSLVTISQEMKILHARAQARKLSTRDSSNATFTISNLGMLGIDSFTAIINPPAACILAVGALQEIPVVHNGQIVPAHMLKVTLSCDHRVLDGAVAALFLSTLKELLEAPLRILL